MYKACVSFSSRLTSTVLQKKKYSETNFFLEVCSLWMPYEMPNHIIPVSILNWMDSILTF